MGTAPEQGLRALVCYPRSSFGELKLTRIDLIAKVRCARTHGHEEAFLRHIWFPASTNVRYTAWWSGR